MGFNSFVIELYTPPTSHTNAKLAEKHSIVHQLWIRIFEFTTATNHINANIAAKVRKNVNEILFILESNQFWNKIIGFEKKKKIAKKVKIKEKNWFQNYWKKKKFQNILRLLRIPID